MTTRNWRLKERKIKCPASTLCIDKYVPSTKVVKVFTENTVWNSPKRPGIALYVVVGGGGGGGGSFDTGAGGGGGGGFVSIGQTHFGSDNQYNIIVGAGGAGGGGTTSGSNAEYDGQDGGFSRFINVIAPGGKGGLSSRNTNGDPGGGGIKARNTTRDIVPPSGGHGSGVSIGDNVRSTTGGGGGGGNSTDGGRPYGGIGLSHGLSGSNVVYGTGGNGGELDKGIPGRNADANTGNGGDGSSSGIIDGQTGGKGGSGIVIIEYYI